MTSFVLILRSTMIRLLRWRRVIGLTILTGATAPMLLLISWGKSDGEVLEFYHGLTITIGMVLAFPIAAIIICTAALGEERKARTMPFLILKPVPRMTIAAAVTTAAILTSFVVMAIGAGLTWLVAAAFTGSWSVGVGATVSIAITAMSQAALFVPIGFLISRATLVGLAYLLIWETILTTAVSGFSGSSTYRIALSAYADVATVDSGVADALNEALGKVVVGAGGALAKVIVMVLISIALTTTLLRRRDLVEE